MDACLSYVIALIGQTGSNVSSSTIVQFETDRCDARVRYWPMLSAESRRTQRTRPLELARLIKDRGLLRSLPPGIQPPPIEECGDRLRGYLSDLVLGEVGEGVGSQEGDDRRLPFGGGPLGQNMGFVVLDHLGEGRSRDRLAQPDFDLQFVE